MYTDKPVQAFYIECYGFIDLLISDMATANNLMKRILIKQ